MNNTELRTYRYITGQHEKTKEMSNSDPIQKSQGHQAYYDNSIHTVTGILC